MRRSGRGTRKRRSRATERSVRQTRCGSAPRLDRSVRQADREEDASVDGRRCVPDLGRARNSVRLADWSLVLRAEPHSGIPPSVAGGKVPAGHRLLGEASGASPGEAGSVCKDPASHLRVREPGILRNPLGLADLADSRCMASAHADRGRSCSAGGASPC